MADLTALQTLQLVLARELPAARANLDAPHTDSGSWFLDVEWNGAVTTVEWRPSQGFGVADADAAFGEGPAFVTRDAKAAALAAVAQLREASGARDALIISHESSFRHELKQGLLDVNVFVDAVASVKEANELLAEYAYRSVVVHMLPGWPEQSDTSLGELFDSRSLMIAVAPATADWVRPEPLTWAEIVIQHSIPTRELALLVRALLNYRDDVRSWPRLNTVRN